MSESKRETKHIPKAKEVVLGLNLDRDSEHGREGLSSFQKREWHPLESLRDRATAGYHKLKEKWDERGRLKMSTINPERAQQFGYKALEQKKQKSERKFSKNVSELEQRAREVAARYEKLQNQREEVHSIENQVKQQPERKKPGTISVGDFALTRGNEDRPARKIVAVRPGQNGQMFAYFEGGGEALLEHVVSSEQASGPNVSISRESVPAPRAQEVTASIQNKDKKEQKISSKMYGDVAEIIDKYPSSFMYYKGAEGSRRQRVNLAEVFEKGSPSKEEIEAVGKGLSNVIVELQKDPVKNYALIKRLEGWRDDFLEKAPKAFYEKRGKEAADILAKIVKGTRFEKMIASQIRDIRGVNARPDQILAAFGAVELLRRAGNLNSEDVNALVQAEQFLQEDLDAAIERKPKLAPVSPLASSSKQNPNRKPLAVARNVKRAA